MLNQLLTAIFDPALVTNLKVWFGSGRVSVSPNEQDFIELAKKESFRAYVVPFFWPNTSGDRIVRRLKEQGVDVSNFLLVLPESMKYADGWTTDTLSVCDTFVFPDEVVGLKSKLDKLMN